MKGGVVWTAASGALVEVAGGTDVGGNTLIG